MTFSDYIIQERSEKFYFTSLMDMAKCNTTLEDWFPEMYADWKLLWPIEPSPKFRWSCTCDPSTFRPYSGKGFWMPQCWKCDAWYPQEYIDEQFAKFKSE